jgi:pimeloyl-ACP methyl ester carboxylesterase
VLIVWGDQDQTTPFANAAHVRALFPRATTLDVAGARHAVHLDFAEQVHPALTAFLSAAEAG